MPKNYGVKEIIVEELKNSELSKENLFEILKERTNPASDESGKKTLDKYLYELLRDSEVDVVGYDLSIFNERISKMVADGKITPITNIPAEGMIFSLTKCEFNEVLFLIKQLEINDPIRIKSLKKIKSLFKNKITEINSSRDSIWRSQLENVESVSVDSFLNSLEEEKLKFDLKEMEGNRLIQLQYDHLEHNIKKLQNILKENKKSIVWYFKRSPIEPGLNTKTIREHAFIMSLNIKTIDDEGILTPEEFLKSHGFIKPEMIDSDDVNDLFSLMQAYINSYNPKIKGELQNRLAWCLSDEKGSVKLLEKFIDEIEESLKNKELEESKYDIKKIMGSN